MPFQIIRNDITKMSVDAIVNTANPHPTYASGVDHAIYEAAGAEELLSERKKIGEMYPGEAKETSALALDAKYIIHTVGPVWEDGNSGEREILKQCYLNSLKRAEELGCESIAFPLISTGVYGFPKDEGLQIAMSTLQSYVMHHKMDIYLVTFDTEAFALSEAVCADIKAYVDDHYVEEAHEANYEYDEELRRRRRVSDPGNVRARLAQRRGPQAVSSQVVRPDDKTFQEKLFEYLDKSGVPDHLFYHSIGMSKQTFSKIRSNRDYTPKHDTAILICIGLHLDKEQTDDLLSRAGYAFNCSNKRDMILQAFIVKRYYDLNAIDRYLHDNGFAEIKGAN